MKIFSAAQIKACDEFTISASGIRSYDLMEQAATKCATWIKDNFPKQTLFVVLCGTGNNGGDGFAITRMLHQRGYAAKSFLLKFSKELSPDCSENFQRLHSINGDLATSVSQDTFITDIPPHIVIIDAIIGSGLTRPLDGWLERFVNYINLLPNRKISIDLPTGLSADVIPDKESAVFQASDTLTFEFYKRTFLHPEAAQFAGNIHIMDIGLSKAYVANTNTNYKTIDSEYVRTAYRTRNAYSHKGDFGHVLLIGGSYGRGGAILMASKAALRAGAGLVTALVPNCVYAPMQTYVPEAMCTVSGEKVLEKIAGWEDMAAIGIGPGMGTDKATTSAFIAFIETCSKPLIIDADALNILSKHTELLAKLPKGSVLTPHPKEFSRIFGDNTNSMIRTDHARIQAMRYNINIVLKGHNTVVITPEGECRYNMTGNVGMATAGSGDVLTGIIAGLAAQGYDTTTAATLGVHLHGLAGDHAAKHLSQEALIAGDIIQNLGHAFVAIRERSAEAV